MGQKQIAFQHQEQIDKNLETLSKSRLHCLLHMNVVVHWDDHALVCRLIASAMQRKADACPVGTSN